MTETKKKTNWSLIRKVAALAVLIAAPFALYAALNARQNGLAYSMFGLIAAAMLYLVLG
ncbi:MAG: hypothetical protein JW750_08935 [Anaerolineaceae bacterium]|nr:hypothetical protein [Anaerolineaceae bacterium]